MNTPGENPTPKLSYLHLLSEMDDLDVITDEDISEFRETTLISEYYGIFDKLEHDRKVRIVFMNKLPEDELLKLAQFALKNGPMPGIHGVIDEIRGLSFCTHSEKYIKVLNALNKPV